MSLFLRGGREIFHTYSAYDDGVDLHLLLEAIGGGERTFSAIAGEAGGTAPLASGTLSPILNTLILKRVIAADSPVSTKADTKNKRYRIADPYLRFWLAFLERGLPVVARGRGDLLLQRIERSWASWRGRAVEPVVRESLLLRHSFAVATVRDCRRPGSRAPGGRGRTARALGG